MTELAQEFNGRNGGLQLREVAGGWQFATRAEYHEHVRAFLKSRPSAKLSIASLETLAVIAYKQPVTVPEILEIRGVQSPSSIKTLLDKKLIVAKGRKETVGRPMMYGTSKEFLMQFGLKDLSELPSVEDFQDFWQADRGHQCTGQLSLGAVGECSTQMHRLGPDPVQTASSRCNALTICN